MWIVGMAEGWPIQSTILSSSPGRTERTKNKSPQTSSPILSQSGEKNKLKRHQGISARDRFCPYRLLADQRELGQLAPAWDKTLYTLINHSAAVRTILVSPRPPLRSRQLKGLVPFSSSSLLSNVCLIAGRLRSLYCPLTSF